MENKEFTLIEVTTRLIEQEARLNILEERCAAQQLVLSWLLARQAPESREFLSAQANEFDQPLSAEKWPQHIDLLDELREDVASWLAQWASSQGTHN